VCLVVVSRDSFSAPSQIIQTYRRAHSSLSLTPPHANIDQRKNYIFVVCLHKRTGADTPLVVIYIPTRSPVAAASEQAKIQFPAPSSSPTRPPTLRPLSRSLSLSLVLLSIFQTKSLAACKNAQGNTSNAERIYSSGGGSGVLSFSPSCSLARTLSLWLYTFLAPPSSATGRKSTTTTTTRSGTMLWLSARARERPFLLWHANQYAVNNYFPNAARIAGCLGDVFCCGCFRACKTKGEIADGILTSTVFEARFSGPLIRV